MGGAGGFCFGTLATSQPPLLKHSTAMIGARRLIAGLPMRHQCSKKSADIAGCLRTPHGRHWIDLARNALVTNGFVRTRPDKSGRPRDGCDKP